MYLSKTHTLQQWNPEDITSWETTNKNIAYRNLFWSIASEHIGFSIWSLWSVLILMMPEPVYHISSSQKFILVGMPSLMGSILRLFYSRGPNKFGGRNFTLSIICLLFLPLIFAVYLMLHPGLPVWLFFLAGAIAGVGGGNYAASMANINMFFPRQLKGKALGLNAGYGNLGVPVMDLCALAMLALAPHYAAILVCGIYFLLTMCVWVGSAKYMNNLPRQTRETIASMGIKATFLHPESWSVCLLYLGCFGSFIGFAFAFSQVLIITFSGQGQSMAQAAIHAAEITFIGPLLGSFTRILGGTWADKKDSVRISIYAFLGMLLSAVILLCFSYFFVKNSQQLDSYELYVFIGCFISLFAFSGIANGSVIKIIPVIFHHKYPGNVESLASSQRAENLTGSLIGITGAVGGLGGVIINLVLRASYNSPSHSTMGAFLGFSVYYIFCICILQWGLAAYKEKSLT